MRERSPTAARGAAARGVVAATVLLGGAAAGQTGDLEYVRRDTREASRRATLARHVTDMELGPWHVAGPFDNRGRDKFDVVYPPERAVDLGATMAGRDDREVRWERLDLPAWPMIDLKRFGTEADNTNGIAYVYREVVCAEAGEVTFEAGSDDGLKLWVNGRQVINADVYRGFDVGAHVITVPLQRGRNTILAKVTQGVGGWQFQVRPRLDPRIMTLLNYHLERDFPSSEEARHYRLLSVLEPEDVVLEVGGLDVMPDGRPIVTTRRGDAWIVTGAYEDPPFDCTWTRFASGLHEPLGARWHDGGLYVAQRGELTLLLDHDGDDRADEYRVVSDRWGVSGNYHEFAFGPKLDGAGRMWVTLNIGFCGSLGKSIVPWRGWALIIEPDGAITPVCGGLRSPNGLGAGPDGAMFYTDNQGDWVGTNKLSHLDFGDWHGHPSSRRWYADAGMPAPRGEEDFTPPAVWFPYDRMGRSASDLVTDDTGGAFGPFAGQVFVGDQYAASIMRVFLERVDGEYQGACFPFRSGLDCGVNRLEFGKDGSLFAGMTNRGWWSHGARPWGLQRVVYTGVVPFEILQMRARPDGFELVFTRPVEATSAADPASYRMASFAHRRWEKYGSPEIDRRELPVRRAVVSEDRRSVRLTVDGLRRHHVHELIAAGVRDEKGKPLLHRDAYYTLNVIPAAGGRAGER